MNPLSGDLDKDYEIAGKVRALELKKYKLDVLTHGGTILWKHCKHSIKQQASRKISCFIRYIAFGPPSVNTKGRNPAIWRIFEISARIKTLIENEILLFVVIILRKLKAKHMSVALNERHCPRGKLFDWERNKRQLQKIYNKFQLNETEKQSTRYDKSRIIRRIVFLGLIERVGRAKALDQFLTAKTSSHSETSSRNSKYLEKIAFSLNPLILGE